MTYILNYTVVTAKLYPNVKGCGYPPRVECKKFLKQFGTVGTTFPCYVSQIDSDLVITELDLDEIHWILLYSIGLPLPILSVSIVYLCFAYLYLYRDDTKVRKTVFISLLLIISFFMES